MDSAYLLRGRTCSTSQRTVDVDCAHEDSSLAFWWHKENYQHLTSQLQHQLIIHIDVEKKPISLNLTVKGD